MFAPAFVDRAAGTGISVGLHFLSLIPFIVFVAALWSRLARASQILAMMAVLGGFGTVMVIAIWQAAVAGVLLQANFVDPTADLRPILAFISSLDQSVTLPLGIFAGAAGLAILGSRIFPRWLGWLALVVGALGVLGVLAIPAGYTVKDVRSALATANPLAFLLWLIWMVGISIVLWRSPKVRASS
jgi:hypothetical protein